MKVIILWFGSLLLAVNVLAADEDVWPRSVDYADRLRSIAGDNICVAVAIVDLEKTSRHIAGECDTGSVYQIGNLTEVFTGILLADAMTRGEISLETPIVDILPEASGFDPSVTVGHLATHFSGLPYLPDNIRMLSSDPFRNYDDQLLLTFLQRYGSGSPGERFLYSSLGVGLLGYLLERVSGLDYEELIRQRVSLPLQLTATTVEPEGTLRTRVLQGHNSVFSPVPPWRFQVLAGAGALYSSLDDLALIVRANLTAPDGALGQVVPITQEIRQQLQNRSGGVALGWMVSGTQSPLYWHAGSTGGYKSFIGFDRSSNLGVVVLANAQISEVNELGSYLLGLSNTLPEIATEEAIGPFRDFVGRYGFGSEDVFRVTSDGQRLYSQSANRARVELIREGGDRFKVSTSDGAVVFDRNIVGQVMQFKLLRDGETQVAARQGIEGEREVFRVAEDILDRYVGRYRWGDDGIIVVTKREDQLMIQFEDQSSIPLYAAEPTRFYEAGGDLEVTFNESRLAGRITSMTVTNKGKRRARRLAD